MKKFIALALALVMLTCALAGCASKGTTLADIQKAGKLTIATSPDFPPFEYLADAGTVEGIEIDIMNAVCAKLGVELDIQQVDFDSVLPGVQAGKYHMGASGISVTPDRAKNVLFTDAYCLAAQAIVVKNGSSITGKADLTGKTIAVQTGTTAESYAMDNGYTVSAFTANSDAQAALLTDKVDAWVIDDLTAAEMVAEYNATNPGALVILSEALTTEPYAFAFKLGSDELVKEINTIINEMVASGQIADIFAKHNAPYTSPKA